MRTTPTVRVRVGLSLSSQRQVGRQWSNCPKFVLPLLAAEVIMRVRKMHKLSAAR